MSRSHLIFYLACLAYLSVLVTAQCNVTGTYDSCCKDPSSADTKVVTFQGKEFRVHCSKVTIPDSTFETNPADCAKKCSSQANCVNAFWRPPIPPSQLGKCDSQLIENEAQSVSFVLIDSAECKNDLKTCQDALKNCKPGDPSCPGNLKTCQDALKNCKPGDPTCPGHLKKCQEDLNKWKTCDRSCPGKLRQCNGAKKKCESDLAKCKKTRPKRTPGPFSCVEGKVENIGGTRYRHHCNQVQVRARSHQPMVSAADPRECAKQCTQRSCKFIIFVNKNACYLHEFEWNSGATKSASEGDTVLQRV